MAPRTTGLQIARSLLFALLLATATLAPVPVLAQATPQVCDVDGDHDIDRNDISLITAARGKAATGPMDPRDPDRDLIITANDARLCTLKCTLPKCAIPSGNHAPVANAGPDVVAFVGDVVTLDGSASSDPDGNPLTYLWTLRVRPAGSAAALSSTTAVMPTFPVDVAGRYEIDLAVNDGVLSSAIDIVIVTTPPANTNPVANAGPDQAAITGQTVTLNGTGSSDIDGDPLGYSWAFTLRPAGSAAVVVNPTSAMPTFVPDVAGTYTIRLTVTDGRGGSHSDLVDVVTSPANRPPLANAGPDQSVIVSQLVFLDGSGSSDPDSNPLTYRWSFSSRPAGSSAALTGATSATPSFVADRAGDFVLQLIVNDGLVDSAADTVVVTTSNTRPVANAGADQTVSQGATATLDGTASSDANGDPLTYFWSLLTVPNGSTAVLNGADTATPDFLTDLAGLFVAQLVVNDGSLDSLPDTTTVTVNAQANRDPSALNDTASMDEDGAPILIAALANDSDPDSDPLTITSVVAPANGTAVIVGDQIRYTPAADFNGTNTFSYSISDGRGGTASAFITVTVRPINDDPVANDDSAATSAGTGVDIPVLANDTDVDGDTLSVAAVGTAANGTTSIVGTQVRYVPNGGFSGTDSFTYTASDGLGDSDSATVTVSVGALPVVSIGDATVTEGAAATLTVTLSPASGQPVTVQYATSDGTATAGADYTTASATLTFAANQTTQTITVPTTADTLDEPDETVNVTLSNPTNATIGDGAGVVTITDDDPTPTLSVGDVTVAEGNTGTTNAVFTVALSAVSGRQVTVNFATSNGTATAGSDYAANSGTLTIPAGQASGTVTVVVNGDTLFEADETFTLTLSGPTNATLFDGVATGTIANDDAAPGISIADVSLAEGNSGSTAFNFTVTLSAVSGLAASVDFATADGTATSPSDYGVVTGTVTIPAGQTTGTATVTVSGDTTVEPDETFSVNLSAPVGATITDGAATGTIVNDDGAVVISLGDATVAEGGTATLTATLSASSSQTIAVQFATSNGTATAGADYSAASGILTFMPGVLTQPIAVTTLGDALDEDDETVNVTLSNATNASIGDGAGLVTITDDDATPALSINDVTVTEGNTGTTSANFAVTLSAVSGRQVTVNYLTSDVTAQTGADYVAANATLTIPAGQPGGTVSIAINGDTFVEANETFNVTLSGPVNATIADGAGVGTIQDDDVLPSVNVTATDAIATEAGTTTGTFTFARTGSTAAPLTVNYTIGGSAANGGDYTTIGTSVAIPAGAASATVVITPVDDAESEGTEAVVLTLAANAGYAIGAPNADTVNIEDNDGPTVTIVATDPTATEAGTTPGTFTFTRTGPTTAALNVFYTIGGAATNGVDYPGIPGIVTILPGDASVTLTITPIDDAAVEGDEGVLLTLTPDAAYTVGAPSTATVTITDDDFTPTVTIVATDATATEAGPTSGTFTFTRSGAGGSINAALNVFFTVGGAASNGTDYQGYSGVVTILPGDASLTLALTPIDDAAVEGTEDVLLTLTPDPTYTVGTPSNATINIIDDDAVSALSIDDITVTEGNAGTTSAVFTVTLSPASGQTVTVNYATSNSSASAPTDFTAASGTLTFNPGALTQTITVLVNGDTTPESNETFSVNLSSPSNATIADGAGVGTINNDDTPAITIGNASIGEGDSGTRTLAFAVTLSGQSPQTVSVDYSTADGTATTASADYQAATGTVTFNPGVVVQNINVLINGDIAVEPAETFVVNLSNPVNATLGTAQATGTILNDDNQTMTLSLLGTSVIGVDRSATLRVVLGEAAPAGGTIVTLTSDAPGIASVGAPGTIAIAQGQTTGTILLNGVAAGTATIRGTAPNFNEATLNVVVTVNLISVPTTLAVPLGLTTSMPVTLAPNAAPAGGIIVAITSSDPSRVSVDTPTVTIPAGAFSANATLRGTAPGTATITATNVNYATGATAASTTASLNITSTSLTINPTLDLPFSIQLESPPGTPRAAPAGGIPVTVSSANPACAVGTTPVTIAAGNVSTTSTASYGGTATLPCTTTLTVSSPELISDTLSVTVNPAPGITMNVLNERVGAGLQYGIFTATLGAPAGVGGVQVTITSSNPAALRVSPNATTAAEVDGSIVVTVAQGATGAQFYLHGVEGQAGQTGTITASAVGYADSAPGNVTITPPVVDLLGPAFSITALSADDQFQVRLGSLNAAGTGLSVEQQAQAGGAGIVATVTLTNSVPAGVAQLTTTAGSGQTRTVTVAAAQSRSPGTVATGGVAFDPLLAGTITVNSAIPGGQAIAAGSRAISVTGAGITTNVLNERVGAGLQYGIFTATLGAPAGAGGVQVTITSSNPAALRVSPNATTAAEVDGSIVVTVNQGATGAQFYLHGVEGQAGQTGTITASAVGYADSAPGNVTITPPVVDLLGPAVAITTLTANDQFQVRLASLNAAGTAILNEQQARAGGAGIVATITLTNSVPAGVAQLVTTAGTGTTGTVTVAAGQSRSPGTVATGGVAFDPLLAGTITVSGAVPGGQAVATSSRAVTVSAPGITTNVLNERVGAGLQYGIFTATLGAPAGVGGVQVTITSSNPAALRVSPNATTAAEVDGSIVVTVNQGATGAQFYLHGVEGQAGQTGTITASAAGYTDSAPGVVTITPPVVDLLSLLTSIPVAAADDAFQVRLGSLNAAGTGLSVEQQAQAGGAGIVATVTLTNSVPAGVAQLTTTAGSGQTRTVTIAAAQSRSPATVAAGGVAFDPLLAGTITVGSSIPGGQTIAASNQGVTVNP